MFETRQTSNSAGMKPSHAPKESVRQKSACVIGFQLLKVHFDRTGEIQQVRSREDSTPMRSDAVFHLLVMTYARWRAMLHLL